jgi:uncharacterized protein DUF6636
MPGRRACRLGDLAVPRTRSALVVLVIVAMSATFAAAATGDIPPGFGHFETPTRNIVCDYNNHARAPSVFCAIKSGLKPPPRHVRCTEGGYTDKFALLGPKGHATMPSCWGDPGPLANAGRGQLLRYGKTLSVAHGAIRCTSAFAGVTCTNRAGHGFFLSRERSRRF